MKLVGWMVPYPHEDLPTFFLFRRDATEYAELYKVDCYPIYADIEGKLK